MELIFYKDKKLRVHLRKRNEGETSLRRGKLSQGMLEEGCRREAGRWQALGYISDILKIFRKYILWG